MSNFREELRKSWQKITNAASLSANENAIAKIRLQTPLKCDFFAAMDSMDGRLMLIIRIPSEHIQQGYKYPDIAGMEIRAKYEEGITGIFLKVIDEKYNELFENLCLDLIGEAANAADEKKCIDRFFYKLHIWKDFFQQLAKNSLDENEAQGLFGELYCLNRINTVFMSLEESVLCWEGPSGSEYDFHYPNGVIEVKTLKAKSDTMAISNMHQLDSKKCVNLFVLHLSVEIYRGEQAKGISLPKLISEIRQKLEGKQELLAFDRKLVAAGYLENSYPELHFDIVEKKFYHVDGNFPRLIPSNIPSGIKSVKYTIDLDTCTSFIMDEKNVFTTVMESSHAQ